MTDPNKAKAQNNPPKEPTPTEKEKPKPNQDMGTYLVNKHGRVVHINSDRAKTMIGNGYRQATEEEVKDFKSKHQKKDN